MEQAARHRARQHTALAQLRHTRGCKRRCRGRQRRRRAPARTDQRRGEATAAEAGRACRVGGAEEEQASDEGGEQRVEQRQRRQEGRP